MERITAMTSAPAWAAARACSTSSQMLPVATIRYLCGRGPVPSSALSALRLGHPAPQLGHRGARPRRASSSRSARSSAGGSGAGCSGRLAMASTMAAGSRAPCRIT